MANNLMKNNSISSYALLLLFFLGIAIAVLGIEFDGSSTLSQYKTSTDHKNKILVTVNGQSITQDNFNLAKNKNLTLSDEKLLALIIDEYLLLQRAQELGLLQADRVIRKAIVHTIIEQEVSKALHMIDDEESLQSAYKLFYQDNLAMFATEDEFQLQIAKFSDDEQCAKAESFKQQWHNAQSKLELLTTPQWKNQLISQPLSNGLYSKTLVYRQLGIELAEQVIGMSKGELSSPIRSGQSCILIYLQNKKIGKTLSYEIVKDRVISEYRTTLRKKTLSTLLSTLRDKADIQIAQDISKLISL